MDDRIFELHAEVCKTLANPWRLKLIELLRDGERPLNLMKAAGVVEVRREGSRSFYRLTNPKILKAFDLMREILRDRLAETREVARALSRAGRR
jgi:ArsR family transcriptional regulator